MHFYFSASCELPSAVWRRIQTLYFTEVLDMMAGMTQKELGTFCRMRSLIPTSVPPVVSILIGEVVSWAPICQAALLLESLRLSDCQIVRLSDPAGESADAYPPISHVARVTSQVGCVIRQYLCRPTFAILIVMLA